MFATGAKRDLGRDVVRKGSRTTLEFPDMQSAKAWYFSPEYQAIIELRTRNVISDLILVDQVAAGFTSAEYAQDVRVASGQQSARAVDR